MSENMKLLHYFSQRVLEIFEVYLRCKEKLGQRQTFSPITFAIL